MLMLRQQNDINLKVEDGDNFMSDYTTYTNYAKKAIDELQQLANFKKSLKGKKLADKIREAGLKLITKSGVDSILHGLGESNGFQNLTPAQKQIAEKVGTSQPHVSDWLNGIKTPSSVNLRKLANAMGCTPIDLVMKLHVVNNL